MNYDTLIIGAGLSGLFSGILHTLKDKKTLIISNEATLLPFTLGTIDILGYYSPFDVSQKSIPVTNNIKDSITKIIDSSKNHIYSKIGLPTLENAVNSFLKLMLENNLPYHGSISQNTEIITPIGNLKPTCLYPESMLSNQSLKKLLQRNNLKIGFINIGDIKDFYFNMLFSSLKLQGCNLEEVKIDFPIGTEHNLSLQHPPIDTTTGQAQCPVPTVLQIAENLENKDTFEKFRNALLPLKQKFDIILMPIILGTKSSHKLKTNLENEIKTEIKELPNFPPSVFAIRLQNKLIEIFRKQGGEIFSSNTIKVGKTNSKKILTIKIKSGEKEFHISAQKFILATGKFFSKGLITNLKYETWNTKHITDNNITNIYEPIFNLDLDIMTEQKLVSPALTNEKFFVPNHPFETCGVIVNEDLQPINKENNIIYENLFASGSIISGAYIYSEQSTGGIALGTAYKTAMVDI